MTYYHVVVETDSAEGRQLLYSDLSESELKAQFVAPYKKGTDLLVDGKIIRANQITRVALLRTEEDVDTTLKELQTTSVKEIADFNRSSPEVILVSPGRGWADEEIEDIGEDVTSQYITGGPGTGTIGTKLLGYLSNPWVVRIGGGVIVLFIAAWFAGG